MEQLDYKLFEPNKINNLPNYELAYLVSRTPRINIAIVGDIHFGKIELVRFWLSMTTDNIVMLDIYSKIVWIEEKSLQLNIHEISSQNTSRIKKNIIFHGIVYVYDLDIDNSLDALPFWIDYMKNQADDLTYQVILGISPKSNEELLLESAEVISARKYYAQVKIAYYKHSLQPSDSLSKFLGMVTSEAFDAMQKLPQISSSNYGDPNMVEMDIFNRKIDQQPLLVRRTGDNSYVPRSYQDKKETGCCSII